MELSFKSNKLEKSLTTVKGLDKNYGDLAKKISKRINELESADSLETIKKLPVLRLHKLIGKRKDVWSIDIQQNNIICHRSGSNPYFRKWR